MNILRNLVSACVLFLAVESARAEIKFNVLDGTAAGTKPIIDALAKEEIKRQGANPVFPNTPKEWWAWGVKLADLDGDGDLDAIFTWHSVCGSVFAKNMLKETGAFKFESWPGQPDNRLCPDNYSPLVFPYSGSGVPDVMAFGESSLRKNLKNNGNGLMTVLSAGYSAYYGRMTVGDFNGDGKPDVRSRSHYQGKTTEYLLAGSGTGTFAVSTKVHPATRPTDLPASVVAQLDALAADTNGENRYAGADYWQSDLNGDGHADCLIRYFCGYSTTGNYFRGWVCLRNPATGLLEDFTAASGLKGCPHLPPFDADGDGRLDILTTHNPSAGLYLQKADGTFAGSSAPINSFVKWLAPYAYVVRSVDFDGDGRLDLAISSARYGQLKVFERQADGSYLTRHTINHWDASGFDIGDVNGDGRPDIVVGGPGPGPHPSGNTPSHADTQTFIYLADGPVVPPPPPPPPPPPVALRLPLPPHDPASPQFARFRGAVDRAMAGQPYYLYAGWHPALMFAVTKEAKYATEAIRLAEGVVEKAEAAIAAGQVPELAWDQYLPSGGIVSDLARVYDWCGSAMTPVLRTRIEALCDQAVSNIWNPPGATWGGRPHPWPGWSVDNPGNNYHFSFLEASINWGLAADRQPLLTQLKTKQLPALLTYYRELPDGGSREGTGYGDAQHTLFQVTNLWRAATQEDPFRSPFFTRGTQYWIHATLPTMDRFAHIGDQARDHGVMAFDYHRDLILQALQFSDPVTASQLRWWLSSAKPGAMTSAFNFPYELGPVVGITTPPTDTHYFAPTLGHYFWRKSWTAESPWLGFIAGPFLEAHASQDQGSFQLFRNRWLVAPANLQSTSGINQATPYQSVVRFTKAGVPIYQRLNQRPTYVTATATAGGVEYRADLSPFYPVGIRWTRRLAFDGARLIVDDTVETPSDVTATWQAILPDQPAIAGNVATVPGMTVETAGPAAAVDLRNDPVDPGSGNRFTGGWRLELPITGSHRATIMLQ